MSNPFVLDLHPVLAAALKEHSQDPITYVCEALAVQLFREEKLSHYELGTVLGLDRGETNDLLNRFQVENTGLTHESVAEGVLDLAEYMLKHRADCLTSEQKATLAALRKRDS